LFAFESSHLSSKMAGKWSRDQLVHVTVTNLNGERFCRDVLCFRISVMKTVIKGWYIVAQRYSNTLVVFKIYSLSAVF
jgi:hypothetical protein